MSGRCRGSHFDRSERVFAQPGGAAGLVENLRSDRGDVVVTGYAPVLPASVAPDTR